jgi:general secretion pathway protein I
MRKISAFTLLEVMVALLVVAITMGAIVDSGGSSARNTSHLKQKTIASWIAQNQISLYRAKKIWSSASGTSGDVAMANTEWHWELTVTATDDPLLRRIDVDVYLDQDNEDVKARATGFIANLL